MHLKLCNAWVPARWHDSLDGLGKDTSLCKNTLGKCGYRPTEGGSYGRFVMLDARALLHLRAQPVKST